MLPLRNNFLACLCLLFFSFGVYGQQSEADTVSQGEYPFINYGADTLINPERLQSFFDKLLKLENGDSSQLSILHIGDSHIQADFLTRQVRSSFQLRFGNAGRGLVFPLRVAGTNEPTDYRSAANISWNTGKIVGQNRNPEPGLSGISVRTNQSGAYIDITTLNHDELDYAFDQVILIHTKDSLQFDCRITDSESKFGYLMSGADTENGTFETWVPFTKPTNFVRIQAEQTSESQNAATFNGMILKNSRPGILYHSVGINGAHFSDYNSSPLFFTQLKALQPDLVIISLGTNEGANTKITVDEVTASVGTMVQQIRLQNPAACILITTPVDDFYRKKYKNPYLEAVQRALKQSASAENVACFDLYNIGGGFGSCTAWRKAGLMQSDGVHFSKPGYALQGDLLYKALIESYLKYAAD